MDRLGKKTALVTGAAGFVGRHLSRELAGQGWHVVGLGHGAWAAAAAAAWGISEWCQAEVNLECLETCGVQPSAIFHCAGSGSVSASLRHPHTDFERTVCTTAAVLEFARRVGRGCRVVLPSSAGVYGNIGAMPIAEDSPLRPSSPYGYNKLLAEKLCESYGANFGVATARVRLFSLHGREQRKLLLWDAYQKLSAGEPAFGGTGRETRDWLHVSDAARLLAKAESWADPTSPVVNGGTGTEVAVEDLLRHFFRCLGTEQVPRFDGVARAGDPRRYQACIQRGSGRGWRAEVSWEQGVADYAQWLREAKP